MLAAWGASYVLDEHFLFPGFAYLVVAGLAVFNGVLRLIGFFYTRVLRFMGSDLMRLLPGLLRILVEHSSTESWLLFYLSCGSFTIMMEGFLLTAGILNVDGGYDRIPAYVQVGFATFSGCSFCRLIYFVYKESHWIKTH